MSCAYIIFDTGSDFLDDLLDQELGFTATGCTDYSVSQDMRVCNEGEVCMAMRFDLRARIDLGTGKHGTV